MSGERMTDAALADELDNIALAFDRNSQYATTIRKAAAALRARPQAVAEGFERVAWQRVSDDGKPLPIFVTLREHLSPVCKYRDVLAAGKSDFVVVPVEPTFAMRCAFRKADEDATDRTLGPAFNIAYRAMLAASQSATGGAT